MYIYNGKNTFAKSSFWLGYGLQKKLNEQLDFKSRGVKFANFQVLREAGDYPAALLEMGFLSNGDESGYLLDNGNTRALALAVLMGIIQFFITRGSLPFPDLFLRRKISQLVRFGQ